MKQSIKVIASLLTDYARMLEKHGHPTAAQLVTQRSNQALADLNSSTSEVPLEEGANAAVKNK